MLKSIGRGVADVRVPPWPAPWAGGGGGQAGVVGCLGLGAWEKSDVRGVVTPAMMSGCGEAMLAAFAGCWLSANCL